MGVCQSAFITRCITFVYMFDFRLRVFYAIVQKGSFSKAAEALHITQPAVTKHVKLLEEHFSEKLFDRKGYKVELTQAGRVLLKHVRAIVGQYQKLEFDMNLLQEATRGQIDMAASTTIAQYWLPPLLAEFHSKFPEVKISMVNGNTREVKHLVLNSKVHLGLIEGETQQTGLSYSPFLKDEIVLVAPRGHRLSRKGEVTLEELKLEKLLIRESGSGTLQILSTALQKAGMPLSELVVEMELGSTESIKSYLFHSDCCAFLSIHTVLKELKAGDLNVIDIPNFKVERNFYLVQRSEDSGPLAKLFKDFISIDYN